MHLKKNKNKNKNKNKKYYLIGTGLVNDVWAVGSYVRN
jgi:predicted AAA+ superfamily ATPase